MHERITEMRSQLVTALRSEFEREMERGVQQITEAIAPYTRFVRSERSKLEEMETALEEHRGEIQRLKARVEQV